MTKLRVYTVKAEAEDGRPAILVHQIEITGTESGLPIRYVIPGHYLRMIRDVLIELVDQHPQDAGPAAGPKQTEGSFVVDTALAKKAEEN